MAKDNGKPKKRGRNPKGVIPPELAAHLIKKGEVRNRSGRCRKSVMSYMNDFFDETVKRELPDGTIEEWPRAKVIAHILGRAALKAPGDTVNHPNWQFSMRSVLERVAPVPRETIFAAKVQI